MEWKKETNIWVLKFRDGEDLLESLADLARGERLTSGFVVSAVGMLRDVELGYFSGEGYVKKQLQGPFELLGMQGNISRLKEDPWVHVHCMLADSELGTVGGHLFRAAVNVACEMCIIKTTNIELSRMKNQDTGLYDLVLKDVSGTTNLRTMRGTGSFDLEID